MKKNVTREEFTEFLDKLTAREEKVLHTKGVDYTRYAREENVLENFDRIADELSTTTKEVIWIYMCKHLHALLSYVKYGTLLQSEDLSERIIDIRNYAALMAVEAWRRDELNLV